MRNADMPAMPVTLPPGESFKGYCPHDGLTKREHFAAMAMQGILANDAAVCRMANIADEHIVGHEAIMSTAAVGMADALLAELERTK